MKNRCLLILFLSMILIPLWSQNTTISQVDTSSLLITGRLNVYASLLDSQGKIIAEPTEDGFSATELHDGRSNPLEILEITSNAGQLEGLNLLLMVDNSGSMYNTYGNGTTRIAEARRAIASFLTQFNPSLDSVGLASFNTFYQVHRPLGSGVDSLQQSLEEITKPDERSEYTELYVSLIKSTSDIRSFQGRRAVIILSDGENYPFSLENEEPHPQWGNLSHTPEEIITTYRELGITIYAVNFNEGNRDRFLESIAVGTGGRSFDASDSEELLNVYNQIRERILSEVKLSIAVPAYKVFNRNVSLSYDGGSDSANYYAPLVLGEPDPQYWIFALIAIGLGLVVYLVVLFVKFEKPVEKAEVMSLDQNMTVALNQGVTVIGSSTEADMTLSGNPSISGSHATIVEDEKTGSFTLVSENPVKVNNRLTKKRPLKPGDVISIEGATIVFDAPEK